MSSRYTDGSSGSAFEVGNAEPQAGLGWIERDVRHIRHAERLQRGALVTV